MRADLANATHSRLSRFASSDGFLRLSTKRRWFSSPGHRPTPAGILIAKCSKQNKRRTRGTRVKLLNCSEREPWGRNSLALKRSCRRSLRGNGVAASQQLRSSKLRAVGVVLSGQRGSPQENQQPAFSCSVKSGSAYFVCRELLRAVNDSELVRYTRSD